MDQYGDQSTLIGLARLKSRHLININTGFICCNHSKFP